MAQLKNLLVSGDARISGNLYHNNPSYGYGTCTTAADVAAKVINTGDPTWVLTAGSVIAIKSTYTNTALNPTLNVNGTGAKSIWYDGALLTTTHLAMAGSSTRPCMYVYDGTNYVWMSWSVDTDFTGTLATVATTGSYNDLSNKPTIPNQLSQLNDDATHRVVTDTEKSTWNAKSNFSGSYTDLTDKPTIPTVYNATLTIQKNGSEVGTFTANQSTDKTINITVPTDYIDTAGTGLTKSGSTLSLTSGVVTAGTKGPTADVTGSDGNTIKVPKVTVDTYGRVTGLAEYTYTSKNTTYSAASGGGLSLSGTAFSLANSGVTAGSYGPSANVSPGSSGSFSVPYVTVDAKGRVTAASTKTITLPNSENKVEQSGIWTYIKFNNGWAICTGVYEFNATINTTWGNLKNAASNVQLPNFPFTFTSVPTVVVSPTNTANTNYMWIVGNNGASNAGPTTTSPGRIMPTRGSGASTSQKYAVAIWAMGKYS